MTEFEILPYEAEHRNDYLRLLSTAWGRQAMGIEAFEWWFDANPAGSLRSVAVRRGEVVGAAGHSFCRARLGGRPRLLQFSVHAVTDASARGLGIFRALERRHEELGRALDSACAICFASELTSPLFLGPLGWQRIDRRRVWARPLRGALGRLRRRRHGGLRSQDCGPDGVRRLERFDAETDQAYERHAPRLGNHLVRDARYLNWRYLDAPKDYRAFASEGGFAVVGHDERRGASFAVLLELVADPGAVHALVRTCARAGADADALLAVPTPCLPQPLLARLGFLPTHIRLDFMGHGLTDALDTRAAAWTVTLGDTDFF